MTDPSWVTECLARAAHREQRGPEPCPGCAAFCGRSCPEYWPWHRLNELKGQNMPATETAKRCRCNRCSVTMIDENPGDQPETPTLPTDRGMAWESDAYGSFWACPVCRGDDALADITTPTERADRG